MMFVATDLDGTILDNDKKISSLDMQSLHSLGLMNIVRVAATGRSMHKVNEVLHENDPFDFIVFSSGGGVYDWKKKEILTAEHFKSPALKKLVHLMIKGKFNFFIYDPIPHNNLFKYHRGNGYCPEYDDYLRRHENDFGSLDIENMPEDAGQLMAIIPNDTALFERLKSEILSEVSGIKIIRTTSPVNHEFIWMEIFPDTVSKGHGIKWLCSHLNIQQYATVGIGNDFNDIDMLEYVGHPFLLGNSPENLKNLFPNVASSNEQSGFSEVLKILGIL